jgi:hypothetical protein
MRVFLLVASVAASCLVSGCSIHPLPEDVTGVSTHDIVRRIRCEGREAVKAMIIEYLTAMAHDHPDIELFEELLSKYQREPQSIRDFHYNLFKRPRLMKVYSLVKVFYDAAVAYNFDLTMTEDNNLSAEADFIRPIVNPKFTLAVTGGASRKRSNDRTFTASDTFNGLLKLPDAYCKDHIVGPNYIYPIAGRIGIDRVMLDFVNLTLFDNLGGGSGSGGGSPSSDVSPPGGTVSGGAKTKAGPPTLTDKLTFTTTGSGGLNPIATFTPVGRNFQVSAASLNGFADRIDMHQVTIGLAIAPTEITDLGSLRSYLFSPARLTAFYRQQQGPSVVTSVVIGNRVIGGGTPAEQLALIAIDQSLSREIQLVPAQ